MEYAVSVSNISGNRIPKASAEPKKNVFIKASKPGFWYHCVDSPVTWKVRSDKNLPPKEIVDHTKRCRKS